MATTRSDRMKGAGKSVLFVPGDRPDRFEKALNSGADAIVLDLEDAVGSGSKDEARENIRRWKLGGGSGIVRVNGLDTPWFDRDAGVVKDSGTAIVMIPKAEMNPDLEQLSVRLPDVHIIPIIESARGVMEAGAISQLRGVTQLAFGNGDLSVDLGVRPDDWDALAFARSSVILASAAARIAPPLDGVTLEIGNDEALRMDAVRAKSYGFAGKMCIHPSQVATVSSAFGSSPDEIKWAKRILAGARDGAAVMIEGEMVDKPLVERAQQILRSLET